MLKINWFKIATLFKKIILVVILTVAFVFVVILSGCGNNYLNIHTLSDEVHDSASVQNVEKKQPEPGKKTEDSYSSHSTKK